MSAARRRSARAIKILAVRIPRLTTATVRVATVFTLGLNPKRARLKIVMGIVVDPGPFRNADITTSSNDKVKVNNQADPMAWEIKGSVTRKNTWNGRAPKSCAASSKEGLISCRRDKMITVA